MTEASQPGQRTAVSAQVLYLVNLLLVPGVAFVILVILFVSTRRGAPALARNHLEQSLAASCWAGVLLLVVPGAMVFAGGVENGNTWMAAIVWFVTLHATMVLAGILGLARAMTGKAVHYPIVGWPFK